MVTGAAGCGRVGAGDGEKGAGGEGGSGAPSGGRAGTSIKRPIRPTAPSGVL